VYIHKPAVEPVARTLNICEASKKKQIFGGQRRQIGIRNEMHIENSPGQFSA
jgi:hypothetical protein